MPKICIVALIGLPAVGKTLLSKLLLDIKSLTFDIIHINYDNILDIKPDVGTVSYKDQRAQLLNDLESLVKSLKNHKIVHSSLLVSGSNINREICKDDVLILCDDNHYYRSMRYKLCQMARILNTSYGQLYIDNPMELALQRNNLRSYNEQVPQEVFERMSEKLETPQPAVYEWELNTLHLKSEQINKESINLLVIPFVLNLFECPLSVKDIPSDVKNVNSSQSQLHNLDVLLRKKIGLFLSSHRRDVNRKGVALMLNEKKRLLLKEFQNNRNADPNEAYENCLELFHQYLEEVITKDNCFAD